MMWFGRAPLPTKCARFAWDFWAVGPTGDTNVAKTVTVSVGSLGPLQLFLEVPDGVPVSFRFTRTDTSLTVSIPNETTEEVPDDPTEEEVRRMSDEDAAD